MAEAEQGEEDTTAHDAEASGRPQRRVGRGWRWLRLGCAGLLLFVCGGLGALVISLGSGPIELEIPGGTQLKMGSEDSVLSNFTFQNGTSYYLDLLGNGVRNIVEVNYLEDSRSIEIVVHHSTKQEREEKRLVEMKLP